MSKPRLASIQLARAIAALVVLGEHLPFVANDIIGDRPIGLPHWLSFGYAAVDLFFVVSGFIISHITEGRPFHAKDFFLRRFVRIIPMYWVFTLAYFAMAFLGDALPPNAGSALFWSLLVWPQVDLPILSVGWTLEHELIFYAIAGLSLYAGMPILYVMTAVTLFAVFVHGVVPWLFGEYLWFWHVFSLYQIQFLIGVFLYRYRETVARLPWRVSLGLGAAGFAGTAYVLGHELLTGPAGYGATGVFRVCAYGVASALVIGGLYAAESRGVLAKCPRRILAVGVLLGDASYTIYLSHRLIFAVLGKLCVALGVGPAGLFPALIFAYSAALLFGVAWFRYVEKPYLDAFHRRLVSR